MNIKVTAIVVSHDAPDYLTETLAALAAQTVQPDRVMVVETSNHPEKNLKSFSTPESWAQIQLADITSFPDAVATAIEALGAVEDEWLWLLHDDSAPAENALAELVRTIELAPSVAAVGPKQLVWGSEKRIAQLGLTTTPTGQVVSPFAGELDQSQHDETDDVLAIGTAGMLVNRELYLAAGALDREAPPLAADVELGIRLRRLGKRIVVAPQATIRHASLALRGQRNKSFLGGSVELAKRKAQWHLLFTQRPVFLALLYWLLIGPRTLLLLLWHLLNKQPQLLVAESAAAIWAFFTLPKRLSRRKLIKGEIPFAKLKPLLATKEQLRSKRFAHRDFAESVSALAEGDTARDATRRFTPAGGWLALLAVLISNWAFLPTGPAPISGSARPLAQSWFDLFDAAGASFQDLGFGLWAPADPFNWVLLGLGSITFWQPSLALSALIFLAPALSFASAWHFVALFARRGWTRNLSAAIYAFAPALAWAIAEARITVLAIAVLLPLFLLQLHRILFQADTLAKSKIWAAVALSGLLLAVISAASPSFGTLLTAAIVVMAIVKIRRVGYVIWVFVPTVAIFGPTLLYYLVVNRPLFVLADPSVVPVPNHAELWQLLLGYVPGQPFELLAFAFAPILILALLGIFQRGSIGLSLVLVLATAAAATTQFLSYPALATDSQNLRDQLLTNSPLPALALVALVIAALSALALEAIPGRPFAAAAIVLLLPLGLSAWMKPVAFSYGDDQVAPAIVLAEHQGGSLLKTLVIAPQELSGSIGYRVALIDGDGVQLEEISSIYRLSLSLENQGMAAADPRWIKIAEQRELHSDLVANLVSANNSNLEAILRQANIGFVLVPKSNLELVRELGVSLDAVKELESIGATEFGTVWRVISPNPNAAKVGESESRWSLTKAIQLGLLAGYLLLAIPVGSSRGRAVEDQSLFGVEGDEA